MSGGALFGNNASRGSSKNLVEFKAGKMTMKGKMVYPDNRKGLLYVYQSDESLMHFCWKDRTTGVCEDDLIIFPDDCEFKHVPQCKTGRVYLLRFKSSSRKFFFWLQDLKTDKDEENCRKVNEVLNNPPTPGSQRSANANPEGDLQNLLNNMSQQQLMQLFGGVGQMTGLGNLLGTITRPHNVISSRSSTTTASTPVTTTATRPPAAQTPAPTAVTEAPKSTNDTSKSPARTSASSGTGSSSGESNTTTTTTAAGATTGGSTPPNIKIQLSDLQNFLLGIPTPAGSDPAAQRGVATELTSAIPSAITTTENLEQQVNTYLPPGDNLCTTLSSPQFSQALSMFWSALQSGQAGPVMRQFGLGQDAVNAATTGNLEEFVTALETEAKTGNAPGQGQGQGQDDKTKKPSSSSSSQGTGASSTDKKDDDDEDEGMSLD